MTQKTISILAALAMLLTAFAAAAETVPEADYTTGTPWLYVDLAGNVTEETEANLKDNFALAANKEKLLKLEIPAGFPCIGTGESRVLQTREDLAGMKRKHLIQDFIPGEDFGPMDPASRRLAERDGKVPRDPDYGRMNHGITLVVL